MKKRSHTSGPKQRKTFFDNYKAVVLLAMVLFFSLFANSQTIDTTRTRQNILANPGYWYISLEAYKGLVPPRDTVRLAQKDSGAIAYKNGRYWQYTGAYWDTIRGAIGGGSGGGIINLSKSYTTTTATITPSGGGTAVTLDAVSGTQAGLTTVAQKTSWDSAWTLRVVVNDSVTWYYNTKGIAVWKDTAYSTAFARPLYIVDSRTVGVKNDSAAWNAKAIQGVNISATAPTTGQVLKYDGSVWKPDTDATGGGGGGTLQDALTAGATLTTNNTIVNGTHNLNVTQSGSGYVNFDSLRSNGWSLNTVLKGLGGGIASDSIIMGAGVIRGNASGGAASLISWSFLDHDGDHTKTYFTNVQGNASGSTIHISYPRVYTILAMIVCSDETLAGRGIFAGPSVGDTSADITVYQRIISSGYLQGNGTGWTKNGSIQNWTVNYNSGTGTISVLPPANLYYSTTEDPQSLGAAYVGSNNYRIRRMLSGLGSDVAGWRVVDVLSNTDVTGNPTTSDIVEIRGLPFDRQVNAYQVSGNNYEASIFTPSANFWVYFIAKRNN